MNNPIVNSKEYWDYRFNHNWESRGGKEQTTGFMKLLISNLPQYIILYLNSNLTPTILDWGCAEGQGVDALVKTLPNANVSGLDVSEVAIEKCKVRYPNYNFMQGCLNTELHKFDVIITSNCLEHFHDPFYWIKQQLQCTNKYYIMLVPFEENLIQEDWAEHKYSFNDKTFPDEVDGFVKVYEKIIDDCKGNWSQSQILVAYEKC